MLYKKQTVLVSILALGFCASIHAQQISQRAAQALISEIKSNIESGNINAAQEKLRTLKAQDPNRAHVSAITRLEGSIRIREAAGKDMSIITQLEGQLGQLSERLRMALGSKGTNALLDPNMSVQSARQQIEEDTGISKTFANVKTVEQVKEIVQSKKQEVDKDWGILGKMYLENKATAAIKGIQLASQGSNTVKQLQEELAQAKACNTEKEKIAELEQMLADAQSAQGGDAATIRQLQSEVKNLQNQLAAAFSDNTIPRLEAEVRALKEDKLAAAKYGMQWTGFGKPAWMSSQETITNLEKELGKAAK